MFSQLLLMLLQRFELQEQGDQDRSMIANQSMINVGFPFKVRCNPPGSSRPPWSMGQITRWCSEGIKIGGQIVEKRLCMTAFLHTWIAIDPPYLICQPGCSDMLMRLTIGPPVLKALKGCIDRWSSSWKIALQSWGRKWHPNNKPQTSDRNR